ncbi:hypothetical protein BRADI_1g18975v3 [Brachypodium distachyon]|uniref:Uncharacterized protein n=1 Tax=Brachypodium distachyon TaxID=15368 RepID=A0A2K2DK20_BRADI|nr:hypothetical protein BRADI_1g18975v3 [Brachypodium distachyon]PNT74624.1 hypothetical protein BRADI_1g18975v3 [Brachypodium distachyon]PNT74626.1 hypothetical protein BRADI_1g18975v3 [Brachypodium distachyon]PNT74628.1 hypothetical protein BRADI_1g18975v3 [Brachypodium distachyon]
MLFLTWPISKLLGAQTRWSSFSQNLTVDSCFFSFGEPTVVISTTFPLSLQTATRSSLSETRQDSGRRREASPSALGSPPPLSSPPPQTSTGIRPPHSGSPTRPSRLDRRLPPEDSASIVLTMASVTYYLDGNVVKAIIPPKNKVLDVTKLIDDLNQHSLNSNARELLECSVCLTATDPPLHQCSSGRGGVYLSASLPKSYSFFCSCSGQVPYFDGTDYTSWMHSMKVHLKAIY